MTNGKEGETLKFIDFHTHVYPEKIALKATKNVLDFYDIKGAGMSGTLDELLKWGRLGEIDKFVILPVALKPEYVKHVNELAATEASEHSELIPFGTVHAECEDIIHELEYVKALGLRGIKLHPDTQLFDIDDKRLMPMYEWLRDNKMPIILHTGDPRHDYSRPEKLRKVLDNFPGLTVIAAHFGGWSLFVDAYAALKDTDCYVDVSSSMMYMDKSQIDYYINGYGEDRVLFGSDYPLWNPKVEKEFFMSLDLPNTTKEKIAYKNAEKLLGIKI